METRLTASLFGADVKAENNSIGGEIKLQTGESKTLSLLVLIDAKDKLSISDAHDYATKLENLIEETRTYWTKLIDSTGGRLPQLKGGTPELQAFYNTGLMSFFQHVSRSLNFCSIPIMPQAVLMEVQPTAIFGTYLMPHSLLLYLTGL